MKWLNGGWLLTAGILACAGGPGIGELSAQVEREPIVVVGSVVDRQEGSPIPRASVQFWRVLGEESTELTASQPSGHEQLTDPAGSFRTEPLTRARYLVVVSALGYREMAEEISIEGASPMELTIRLVPEAMELEPVIVRGVRSQWLANAGFYDRRERGTGRTFTREELARRSSSRVTDVFRTIAGARLVSAGGHNPPFVTFRGGCLPDIVIDGMNLGYDLRLDDLITAHEIEGLEVYRGPATPLQYSTSGCGAIVVWTLDPSALDGEPFSWRRLAAVTALVAASLLLRR